MSTSEAPSAEHAVVVFVPTYGRAQNLGPLIESFRVTQSWPSRLLLIVERGDQATLDVAASHGVDVIFNEGPGTYASCINLAYERTREPFFFLGADDIRFTSGWLDAAMAEMENSRVCVVGSVDPARNEKGDHADHYLIRRSYIDERGGAPDRVGRVLYPYHHAFTDAEFISVAKARNVYQLSSSCFVEHHHPGWTDGGKVSNVDPLFDATYAKGNKYLSKDRRTLRRRSHLWYIDLIERRTPSEADLRWARLVGHPSQSRFRILRKEIYLYGQDWYWRLRVWAKKLKLR